MLQISAQSLKPVPALVQQSRVTGAAFVPVRLFKKTVAFDVPAARFAQGAQFLALEPNRLKELLASRPEAIALSLPYNQEELVVDLVRVNVLSSDFIALSAQAGSEPVPVQAGVYYRGQLRGADQSLAAFSFFDNDEIMGLVSDERHNNLVLGKVQRLDNGQGYMLYSDQELAMDNPFECNVQDPVGGPSKSATSTGAKNTAPALRVALEADYQLFQNRGSVQATFNYLSGVFNQVAAVFANEKMGMTLSQVVVWDTPDQYAGSKDKTVLEQFRTTHINATDANLFQLVGLYEHNPESSAYLGSLCQPGYAVAYSSISVSYSHVPTYSWATEVIAHQMGHNLGAQHTQWCGWPGGPIDQCQLAERECAASAETTAGNTVMSFCPLISSGVNFSKGFGLLPGNLIRNTALSASCLAPAKKAAPAEARAAAPAPVSTETLSLSPNPATSHVTAQIRVDAGAAAQIVLLDLTGRPVLSKKMQPGEASVEIDLNNMPKGIYLVQVLENEKMVTTKRLIKE